MHPLTKGIPKALLHIAGKTLLEWTIERYNQSGIDEIVVAVGWKGLMIQEFVEKSNIKAKVVHVSNYEIGPLQTLLTAIETFDGDFLLSPVDAMIDPTSMVELQTHYSQISNNENMILAVGTEAETGTKVEFDENGLLTRIGDVGSGSKNIARSAMLFIANTSIRAQCRVALNSGKERFAQLLAQMIQDDGSVRCYQISSPWFDIDTLEDLLNANQHYLQRGGFRETTSIFVPSGDIFEVGDFLTLKSNIVLGKGTYLQGPVLISSDCEIGENCQLGPNVTIDSNAHLENDCEVLDAVIFGKSTLSSRSHVHRSVIYNSSQYNAEL